MPCSNCGLPLLGTEQFCPQCGARVASPPAETGPADPAPQAPPPAQPQSEPPIIEVTDVPLTAAPTRGKARPGRRLEPPSRTPPVTRQEGPATPAQAATRERHSRLVGPMGLGILAGCLVFFVIGLAGLGIIEGLRLRSQNQGEAAARHYALGVEHLRKGEYDLAAAELEWALRLRPGYPEAQEKLIEARSKAARQPSPTSPTGQNQSPALLSQGRAAYDRGAWDEAIQKLEAVRTSDPTYEQALVQKLLVSAYTNSGLKLVNEDRLEEAIRRFDQALALQPDNPDVLSQRRLAALYQSAIGAWGVDWKQAIKGFSSLYALKPDYKDTTQRLQRANVLAGDAAAAQSSWCDALQYYKAALNLASTPEVAAKRDEAARNCAAAGTPQATAVPSGTFVGSFGGHEDIRFRTQNWAKVTGRVVNAKGEGVPGLQIKISAFNWSAIAGTDANGYYAFEFLQQETKFTVTIVGRPTQPVEVPTKFGYAAIANFEEKQ